MIVFKCDRCGEVFGTGLVDATKKRGDIWPGNTVVQVDERIFIQGDFCGGCLAQIRKYISVPPPLRTAS